MGCEDIFFIFQDGGRRHLGLSNSQNFILCRCLEGQDASLYQISSKLAAPLRRYCDFSNFQDGRCRHLEFLKSQNFIGWRGLRGISMLNFVKIGQSVTKILRSSLGYHNSQYNFTISKIQDGGGQFENSKNRNISATERPILTKFITVVRMGPPDTDSQ